MKNYEIKQKQAKLLQYKNEYAKTHKKCNRIQKIQDNKSPEYQRIHKFLRRTYGNANKCINPQCPGFSQKYNWCKKRGYEYEFNKDNFIHLCTSCHKKYDSLKEDSLFVIIINNEFNKNLT